MPISLVVATVADLPRLLPLVREYHAFEEIAMRDAEREKAVAALLSNEALGGVWLVFEEGFLAGYVAVCTIFSIEFGGLDAMIDEFFLMEDFREHGVGKAAIRMLKKILSSRGVRTMTLEVAQNNLSAREFYSRLGFQPRERYLLMSCAIPRGRKNRDRHIALAGKVSASLPCA